MIKLVGVHVFPDTCKTEAACGLPLEPFMHDDSAKLVGALRDYGRQQTVNYTLL